MKKKINITLKLVALVDGAKLIMEDFVRKVESGQARSTQTYAAMKRWLKEEAK